MCIIGICGTSQWSRRGISINILEKIANSRGILYRYRCCKMHIVYWLLGVMVCNIHLIQVVYTYSLHNHSADFI